MSGSGGFIPTCQPGHIAKLAQKGEIMRHEKLWSWRESLCLGKKDASELLGVDQDTYERWETGTLSIPDRVALACSAVSKRWQGKNPLHGPIIKSILQYKEAYRYFYKSEPQDLHLIPLPWTSLKYGQFDLSPNAEQG
jgi:hypothetical protein